MTVNFLIVFILSSAFSGQALGRSLSQSSINLTSPLELDEEDLDDDWRTFFSIEATRLSLLESNANLPGDALYQITGAVWLTADYGTLDGYFALPLQDQYSSTFSVREAFLSKEYDGVGRFSAGRKKIAWSTELALWQINAYEPHSQQRPLFPEREGLTGFFYEVNPGPFSLSLFSSPFYIPEAGAPFRQNGARIESASPWFHAPPERTRLFGEDTEIQYTINRPRTEDVVLQSSFGLISAMRFTSWGFQVQYVNKPRNIIETPFRHAILPTNPPVAALEIDPVVERHQVWGAQANVRLAEGHELSTSAHLDQPDRPDYPDSSFHRLRHQKILSTFTYRAQWNFWLETSLSYLTTSGKRDLINDPVGLARTDFFPIDYLYDEAVKIRFDFNRPAVRNWRIQSDIVHSLSSDSDSFSLQNFLEITTRLELVGSVGLIRSRNNELTDYFYNNRNLDYFEAGARYVF